MSRLDSIKKVLSIPFGKSKKDPIAERLHSSYQQMMEGNEPPIKAKQYRHKRTTHHVSPQRNMAYKKLPFGQRSSFTNIYDQPTGFSGVDVEVLIDDKFLIGCVESVDWATPASMAGDSIRGTLKVLWLNDRFEEIYEKVTTDGQEHSITFIARNEYGAKKVVKFEDLKFTRRVVNFGVETDVISEDIGFSGKKVVLNPSEDTPKMSVEQAKLPGE